MYIFEYKYLNIYLAIHEKIKDMIILTKVAALYLVKQ